MIKCKLGDILEVKRGTSLSGKYYSTSGKLIRLTLGNFNYPNGGFKKNTAKADIFFIGPVKNEFILKKGDIITPLTEQVSGLLGETARIPESNKYIQSGDIGLIIPDESKLNKSFAYYLVSSPQIKKQLGAAAQQTKIRHTSPEKIKSCETWLPDLKYQEKAGYLLDSINLKINDNIKMSKELEQIVKTIYNYWFLQYEYPKDEENHYNLLKEKFVWNDELKIQLPKNWKVKKVSEIVDLISGYAFSSKEYTEKGKYKLYTIKNVHDGNIVSKVDNYISDIPDSMPNECFLHPNDIVMSLTGNVGRVGLVYEENALLNQRLLKIVPKNNHIAFIYLLFRSSYMKTLMERLSTGTSQKNLSPVDIGNIKIVVPSESILNKFDEICNSMIYKCVNNLKENQELRCLRDFLLPLLMNGQVGFKD